MAAKKSCSHKSGKMHEKMESKKMEKSEKKSGKKKY
jgi:hypothetical protein